MKPSTLPSSVSNEAGCTASPWLPGSGEGHQFSEHQGRGASAGSALPCPAPQQHKRDRGAGAPRGGCMTTNNCRSCTLWMLPVRDKVASTGAPASRSCSAAPSARTNGSISAHRPASNTSPPKPWAAHKLTSDWMSAGCSTRCSVRERCAAVSDRTTPSSAVAPRATTLPARCVAQS